MQVRNKPTLLHKKSTVFHEAKNKVSGRVYLVVVKDPTTLIGKRLLTPFSKLYSKTKHDNLRVSNWLDLE